MATHSNILPFEATHPGVLIKDELDARSELKQKDLAMEIGVKASFLNEVIKGKRPVTADLAILLEKTLGISAGYWMKFQSQYEIDKARIKEKNILRIKNIEIWSVIKKYVPVNYFKKHAYTSGNLEADIPIIKNIYKVNNVDELASSFANNKFAFYKKSEKLQIDEINMFAWSSLAFYEAINQKVNTFISDNFEELYRELNDIFYTNTNTINKAKTSLNKYGIKFILIEKLKKTPVDGFSFWSGDNPAIALTLRHSRIDNFAFTLMHEIAHIVKHLKNNKEKSFLDFTTKDISNTYEIEADYFAQEKLISKKCWDDISNNYLPLDDDKIIEVGEKYNINPAILLGRICFQMNYYAVKTEIDKGLK